MSWFCSVCEKSFSRKDSTKRRVMSKHRNACLTSFQTVPMSSEKCQRFRFEHPYVTLLDKIEIESFQLHFVYVLCLCISEF